MSNFIETKEYPNLMEIILTIFISIGQIILIYFKDIMDLFNGFFQILSARDLIQNLPL
jgi:hypothetical protein